MPWTAATTRREDWRHVAVSQPTARGGMPEEAARPDLAEVLMTFLNGPAGTAQECVLRAHPELLSEGLTARLQTSQPWPRLRLRPGWTPSNARGII
jgi:hypothetical protein